MLGRPSRPCLPKGEQQSVPSHSRPLTPEVLAVSFSYQTQETSNPSCPILLESDPRRSPLTTRLLTPGGSRIGVGRTYPSCLIERLLYPWCTSTRLRTYSTDDPVRYTSATFSTDGLRVPDSLLSLHRPSPCGAVYNSWVVDIKIQYK